MDLTAVSRAALGSTASLGDLYDARTDTFCETSLFKGAIPTSAVTLTDAHFSDIHLVFGDDFSEKVKKFDVTAELQVSVLAGMLKLEGSGRYLSDQKQSAKTVKSSLVYNVKTVDEHLNIYHDNLKEIFCLDALKSGRVTHVVVGISWGANSILSCLYENKEDKDSKEIKGSLSALLEKTVWALKGKAGAKVSYEGQKKSTGINFDIHVFGDILSSKDNIPTTFDAALKFMSELPKMVGACNHGKGKPMAYQLLPVSSLQAYLNCAMETDVVITGVHQGSLIRVVQMFDRMSNARQLLHDLLQDVNDHRPCVKREDFNKIAQLKIDIAIHEACLRTTLSQVLQDVRSGQSNVAALEQLIHKYQSSDFSPENVMKTLDGFGAIREKMKFYQELVTRGVTYIGHGTSLDEEIMRDFDTPSYILYYTQDAKSKESARWLANRQIFIGELKRKAGCRYYVVDCDVHPDHGIPGCCSCVQVLQSGRVLVPDAYAEQQQTSHVALVQFILNRTTRVIHIPNKTVPLVIRCAGKMCNSKAEYEWRCKKCQEGLYYDFEEHVYCRCGKTSTSSLEFKCSDAQHGLIYEQHDPAFLKMLLSLLRPFQNLNILILGETGVGKSTWINGFVNFLSYETIEEAEKGDLINLIPSRFTVYNENFKKIVVSTGHDKNEVELPGASSTQGTKVYPFTLGKTTVRLIDTPGIGDTRGVIQDKKNFENVLSTLSFLDELHGICILMKPNNSILNVMFRFCIKELLTHLHRDASKNIMFCFTNSRETFYRPGDSMPPLEKLLSENPDVEIPLCNSTVYFYDSEAYRFLAAVKNQPPIKFQEDERLVFAQSWQKSLNETKRMLTHIKSLPPHRINNTVSLNHARELVLRSTRPLAEISRNIQTNKAIVEDEKREIAASHAKIKDLKEKLMITRTEIEVKPLEFPKTVCAHPDCVTVRTLNGVTTTEYRTVCHDHCYIAGVKADSMGDIQLMDCEAMSVGEGVCHYCKHNYRQHMHVYFDSVQVAMQVKDETVNEMLKQKLTDGQIKKKLIATKNKEIEEYEFELKKIESSSVLFAYFLKTNAITPYNDALEEYINHLIREEKNKMAQGGNAATHDNLVQQKNSYIKQKEILEQKMNKNEGKIAHAPPGPEKVELLVKELKGLKHSGKTLAEALGRVSHTQKATYKEAVVQPPKNDCNWGYRFCKGLW